MNYNETAVDVLREVQRKLKAAHDKISACTHMTVQAQNELDIDVVGQEDMENSMGCLTAMIQKIGEQIDAVEEENENMSKR